jgi:hypothetical protein
MPHHRIGHLNYVSNSNLDYNNPMNMRRFGAYAGIHLNGHNAHHHMGGLAIDNLAGLVINEMGGIAEDAQEAVMESPFLYAGLAMIAYPHAKKAVSKKKVSKKHSQQLLYAGLGSIAFHYLKPMMMGE